MIATPIDDVGVAAIKTTMDVIKISVDFDISFFSPTKIVDAVEIEARLLRNKEKRKYGGDTKDGERKDGGRRATMDVAPSRGISFDGGVRNLVLDTIGHSFSQKYHNRVIQHEAGHFLLAYLLGILPKGYTLSSLEALTKEGSLNVQAGTAFVDFEFLEEIKTGKVSAKMLNRFSCIALAGVATEYLLFGYSEGGLSDINQLDRLLKGLGFTQKKADSQVRWAVLNTVLLLRRHEKARSKLADAMSSRESVGQCIDVIENAIDCADV